MIEPDLNSFIATAGDNVLWLLGALIVGSIVVWVARHDDMAQHKQIVTGLAGVIFGGVVLRIGLVSLGRHQAPDGANNHPLWFDWRWLVILIAAVIAIWFARRMFQALPSPRIMNTWLPYIGIIGLALVLAI